MEKLFSLPSVSKEKELHLRRYYSFIFSRKNRVLKKTDICHKHHIVPRSLGGSDDENNLIILTSREHYIAHMILWKCGYKQMITAFFYMSHNHRHQGIVSSRLYESLMHDYSNLVSLRFKNVPFTEEHKANISVALKGRLVSLETREKIRNRLRGSKDSEETKRKKAVSHIGEKNVMFGVSAYDVILAKYGKDLGEEKIKQIKEKLSKKSAGSNNPMYGKSSLENKTLAEIEVIKLKKQATWAKKEKKDRAYKGSIWITNGIINKYTKIKPEEIPEGWKRGRTKK